MATVTVTIGLNSNRSLAPLPRPVRRRFVRAVQDVLAAAAATVFVDGAVSSGTWRDVATGILVSETSRTWVADVGDLDTVRAALPALCRAFEQDAVALTVGETTLAS